MMATVTSKDFSVTQSSQSILSPAKTKPETAIRINQDNPENTFMTQTPTTNQWWQHNQPKLARK